MGSSRLGSSLQHYNFGSENKMQGLLRHQSMASMNAHVSSLCHSLMCSRFCSLPTYSKLHGQLPLLWGFQLKTSALLCTGQPRAMRSA